VTAVKECITALVTCTGDVIRKVEAKENNKMTRQLWTAQKLSQEFARVVADTNNETAEAQNVEVEIKLWKRLKN